MPRRPAMAIRWMTALVDPPMAMSTVMAFSSAARVMMRDGRRSSRTISTMRRPLISAMARRRESGAGTLAQPGRVMPSASAWLVMVEAVPITVQWPALRAMHPSISHHSSSVRRPVRKRSKSLRPSVPEPRRWSRHWPASIGPPGTMMAGMSALAAPMSCAGVVLSQPHSSTTPSSGLARMDSSTSMAIRLR